MLPEPTSHTSTATTQNSTEHTQPTSQHGRLRDDGSAVLLSPVGAGATGADEQASLDAAVAASLQDAATCAGSGERGLKSRGTPSPPARNRILEYEQASTPPVKKREGPVFEVIKKPRVPGDKRSPIQDLPNEVLTHALARLTPNDLASVSRVSKRFHDLVTGPHAWRTAFSHFFPGPDSINTALLEDDSEIQTIIKSERRTFTRLTALASWRSEYIMRTRLLRSLSRGKPVQAASSHATRHQTVAPTIMYNSQLYTTINHIHATFGPASNKKLPRFTHGADEFGTATSSDPLTAKVDSWGLQDPSMFPQFVDRFPGDSQFGLGAGEIVGVPNSMDVSQPYGMIVGEGSPGGAIYYRSTEEMRGRHLSMSFALVSHELGIPKIASDKEAITATWIAKSAAIPSLTRGLVGLISGSSLGVLTTYSLGASSNGNNHDQRYDRGQMTARWVLSPGVPLIAIAIDNEHSPTRMAQNRIWAVVLNALGEVFYLTKFPKRAQHERGTSLDDPALEQAAWQTGRTVYWNVVEPSRRTAKIDPYADASVDGSYSPRSSWNGMCLSKAQIAAETQEIETFATRQPKDFQRSCTGWDMRRKLEVDFAGDDGSNAGENIIVFECGRDEEAAVTVKRFTRCRFQDRGTSSAATPPKIAATSEASTPPSLFGGSGLTSTTHSLSFSSNTLSDSLGHEAFDGATTPRPMTEEWRTTIFTPGGLKNVEILASALDQSNFAIQTTSEDPLLGFSGQSASSSPTYTPLSASNVATASDVPGQRARLFAAGTKLGSVLLWDIRAPTSRSANTVNTVEPLRIIHTDSPEISCLALSSLCLVHGGNDGLVQAWDVLASEMQPVRTLNSRFSSRARRRLIQAQASPQGVGINLFAAGAIALDPDPTVLRGMVSLGTHLLYWAYSSSAADQYKSNKRRMRRSERGSNAAGERFSVATRSNLKNYIENEKFELHREKEQRSKESQRFAGRFGTELLDGSEEEMIAYAAMLSQEAYEQDHARRASDTSASHSAVASSTNHSVELTPAQSPSALQPASKTEDELDADIAEAIRQSLATSPSAGYEIPIRHAKPKNRRAPSAQSSPRPSPALTGSSQFAEMNDLDFAIQLSLAEEQSKQVASEEEAFPGLPGTSGKGKGRKY